MLLLLAAILLGKARLGIVYHTPIYGKGPSQIGPWQAIVVGAFCLLAALWLIVNAVRPRKPKGDK